MNPEMIGILVPIALFATIAVVLWKYFEGRNKERIVMLEKGINPLEFKSIKRLQISQGNILSNIKLGLLFGFVGIGILIGYQLHNVFGVDYEIAVFGSVLICGGLALIIFYFIAAKKIKEKKDGEN